MRRFGQGHKQGDYSIFDFDVQEPLAYARGTATATVRERLNTRAEIALNKSPHTIHSFANRHSIAHEIKALSWAGNVE